MDKDNTKYCRCCHTIKPNTEFTSNKLLKTGLKSKCKQCIKQKNKQYYEFKKIVVDIEKEFI